MYAPTMKREHVTNTWSNYLFCTLHKLSQCYGKKELELNFSGKGRVGCIFSGQPT